MARRGVSKPDAIKARFSDLCTSGDTYGNFLRLAHPADPCLGRPRAIRRTHRAGRVFGRLRGICRSFLRPVPQACLCFHRHVAIPRIGRRLDHGRRLRGRRPDQPE
jgi:hypothetical protein